MTLPRTLVREIGNVTICGLQERRNETVKACKIKIISWRHFKKSMKHRWPNERSWTTAFLSYYEWTLTLTAQMMIHSLLSLQWNHRLRVFTPPVPMWKSHIASSLINLERWGVKGNHNRQCQYFKYALPLLEAALFWRQARGGFILNRVPLWGFWFREVGLYSD